MLSYNTMVNYLWGLWIYRDVKKGCNGKFAVSMALVWTLLQLVVFKYAYLFETSILLPVGLSFFTFQALSYSIDIYRGKIIANKNVVDVALFIAFFPTLLSGPIERARNLIPQLQKKTEINYEVVSSGVGLFIWGLFKKVVIADRLAVYVDSIYFAPDAHSGSTLALAVLFYSFQIYCDFSGYTDMAIGVGRALGFNIMQNFNLPYCASTIRDFWKRWHISLTTWFTEYVYIAMGGNRVTKLRWVLNISAVFLLRGIWHGATISFIIWGGIYAVLYLIEHFLHIQKPNILYRLIVFIAVSFAWVFFRLESAEYASLVIWRVCSNIVSPIYLGSSTFSTAITIVLLICFIIREWLQYREVIVKRTKLEYLLLIFAIALFGVSNHKFVSFKF